METICRDVKLKLVDILLDIFYQKGDTVLFVVVCFAL
jgi:hypothetical protein